MLLPEELTDQGEKHHRAAGKGLGLRVGKSDLQPGAAFTGCTTTEESFNLFGLFSPSVRWGPLEHLLHKDCQKIRDENMLWKAHSPRKMGGLRGHMYVILMTWFPASHKTLFQMTQRSLLWCFSGANSGFLPHRLCDPSH